MYLRDRAPESSQQGGLSNYVYVLMYTHALGTESVGAVTDHLLACVHEQPLVAPHVSHFRQVPLRTSVKLPHSLHASPS